MGSRESRDTEIVKLLDRLVKRQGEFSLEILSLRRARTLDSRDIQDLVERLDKLRYKMESDLLLALQYCPS